MKKIPTKIHDAWLLKPKVFGDARGFFMETWNRTSFRDIGLDIDFVQDNQSVSQYGVLRGLHFQRGPMAQAKLVRVAHGVVLDVVVDLRPNSKTCGAHFTIELSAENGRQLFGDDGRRTENRIGPEAIANRLEPLRDVSNGGQHDETQPTGQHNARHSQQQRGSERRRDQDRSHRRNHAARMDSTTSVTNLGNRQPKGPELSGMWRRESDSSGEPRPYVVKCFAVSHVVHYDYSLGT